MSETKKEYYKEYNNLEPCLVGVGIHRRAHDYIKELENHKEIGEVIINLCKKSEHLYEHRIKELEEQNKELSKGINMNGKK